MEPSGAATTSATDAVAPAPAPPSPSPSSSPSAPPQPSAASLAALRRVLLKGRARNASTQQQGSGGSGSALGSSSLATNMRWSPFGVFTAKTVAIEEDEDPNRRDELYNVVEYRWSRGPFTTCSSATCAADSSSSSAAPQMEEIVATLRERREACGPSVNDIRVAQQEGIDNTGNFHWPTEDVMCRYLVGRWFSSNAIDAQEDSLAALPPPSIRDGPSRPHLPYTCNERVSFLELGAGCGLAAFVLSSAAALCNPPPSQSVRGATLAAPAVRIVATDGNSRVVETLRSNVRRQYTLTTRSPNTTPPPPPPLIVPMVLPWQSEEKLGEAFALLDGFDKDDHADADESSPPLPPRRKVLFGADCLFFEDYHHQLADLIIAFHQRYASPSSSSSSLASSDGCDHRPLTLLMAPSRGGSFERFEAIFKAKVGQHQDQGGGDEGGGDEGGGGQQQQAPYAPQGTPLPLTCHREDNFDPFITDLHGKLMAGKASGGGVDGAMASQYNPDRHYPMLLVIE